MQDKSCKHIRNNFSLRSITFTCHFSKKDKLHPAQFNWNQSTVQNIQELYVLLPFLQIPNILLYVRIKWLHMLPTLYNHIC